MTSIDNFMAPVATADTPPPSARTVREDRGFAEMVRRAQDDRPEREAARGSDRGERNEQPKRISDSADDHAVRRDDGTERRRTARARDEDAAETASVAAATAPSEPAAGAPASDESAAAFAGETSGDMESGQPVSGAADAAAGTAVDMGETGAATADDNAVAAPPPAVEDMPTQAIDGAPAPAPQPGDATATEDLMLPAAAPQSAAPVAPAEPAEAAVPAIPPASTGPDLAENAAVPADQGAGAPTDKSKLRNAKAATPAPAALAHAAANSAAVAPSAVPDQAATGENGGDADAAVTAAPAPANTDSAAAETAYGDEAADDADSPADRGSAQPARPETPAHTRTAEAAATPKPADPAMAGGDAGAGQDAGVAAPPAPAGHSAAPAVSAPAGDLRLQPQTPGQPAEGGPRVPAPPAEQIAVEIGRAVREGRDRFSLELRPGDLGRISVDLQIADDRRVTAIVHVDRPETLQLLQRDSHALERSLQQAGLRADMGSLSFNLRSDGGGSQQQAFADGSRPSQSIAVRLPAAAAQAAAHLARPWRLDAAGVDIRV